MSQLNWADACAEFDRVQSSTKTIAFDLPGGELTFGIRMLTQHERDRIIEGISRRRRRYRGDTMTAEEVRQSKEDYIRAGVVSGPEGWTGSAEDISMLPVKIRDQLADAIEDYATLDEETRVGFR